MEEESGKRNPRGIREEDMDEENSWRRLMEERSLRSNHSGDIMEEELWRRIRKEKS